MHAIRMENMTTKGMAITLERINYLFQNGGETWTPGLLETNVKLYRFLERKRAGVYDRK